MQKSLTTPPPPQQPPRQQRNDPTGGQVFRSSFLVFRSFGSFPTQCRPKACPPVGARPRNRPPRGGRVSRTKDLSPYPRAAPRRSARRPNPGPDPPPPKVGSDWGTGLPFLRLHPDPTPTQSLSPSWGATEEPTPPGGASLPDQRPVPLSARRPPPFPSATQPGSGSSPSEGRVQLGDRSSVPSAPSRPNADPKPVPQLGRDRGTASPGGGESPGPKACPLIRAPTPPEPESGAPPSRPNRSVSNVDAFLGHNAGFQ
jgi:hypothetical protein